MPEASARGGMGPAMIDARGGVEEVFMWLDSGVVTEWVKCLHQFGAIIMSKGEEGAWKESQNGGGGGENQKSICIQQAYSFTGTYVRSSPLPLPCGQASLP